MNDSHGLRPAGEQVHLLSGLLSEADVQNIHAAAREIEQTKQTPLSYDNTLRSPEDEMPFGMRAPHESLFLHADGFFAERCPAILEKILFAMRRCHGDSSRSLGVRTIEYHSYRIGGGLLDPDHCDMGSTLTLSALLSPREALRGGVFVTFHDDPVEERHHDNIACGDAIVFDSERRHNVTAVLEGTRNSLVVELWEGPDNTRDRHS